MSACDGRAFFAALYQQNQSIAAWGFVLYSSKRLIAAWGLSYKPDLGKIVAYQIYIKSFCDSDGDGIGDLPGITSKLDYLASLGIDYVWITPFFPSPQRDNGYDVSDYCAVDPVYGTMGDFDELVSEARARASASCATWCSAIPPWSTPGSSGRLPAMSATSASDGGRRRQVVAGGGRWGRCRRERRGAAVCLFAACGVHGREAGAVAHAMVAAGVAAASLRPPLVLELVIAAA